jgi:hypothetical protein
MPNDLSVKYLGSGRNSHDVGAVQAVYPIQRENLYGPVGYFEIRIDAEGEKTAIGIGLTTSASSLVAQPGWEIDAYGYHADDGNKFHGSGSGVSFGPTATKGDVLGCGFLFRKRAIFFTKNGKVVGISASSAPRTSIALAFHDVRISPCLLYPTVGVHSPGECVTVQFLMPFRFNIESVIDSEWKDMAQHALNCRAPIAPFLGTDASDRVQRTANSDLTLHQECYLLCLAHVLEYGFVKTARSLILSPMAPSSVARFSCQSVWMALNVKAAIRQAVLEMRYHELATALESIWSTTGQFREAVNKLRQAHAVSLCASGRPAEGIAYARQHIRNASAETVHEILGCILRSQETVARYKKANTTEVAGDICLRCPFISIIAHLDAFQAHLLSQGFAVAATKSMQGDQSISEAGRLDSEDGLQLAEYFRTNTVSCPSRLVLSMKHTVLILQALNQ